MPLIQKMRLAQTYLSSFNPSKLHYPHIPSDTKHITNQIGLLTHHVFHSAPLMFCAFPLCLENSGYSTKPSSDISFLGRPLNLQRQN